MPSGVQQQIVGFDVSMNESSLVNGVERQHSLRDIHPCHVFRECICLKKVNIQVTESERERVCWGGGQGTNLIS